MRFASTSESRNEIASNGLRHTWQSPLRRVLTGADALLFVRSAVALLFVRSAVALLFVRSAAVAVAVYVHVAM